MSFREWISTADETPACDGGLNEPRALTAGRKQTIEAVMWGILTKTRDEILRGGIWNSSPETEAIEIAIGELYQAVTDGRATLEAFAVHCKKWIRAGTGGSVQHGSA